MGVHPKFTPEQDAFLVDMRAKGATWQWLGDQTGFSLQGARNRWITITSPKPESKPRRKCLSCGGTFPSTWAGNRICHGCKLTAAWRSGDDYTCDFPL